MEMASFSRKISIVWGSPPVCHAPGTRHRITAVEDTDIFEVSTSELDDVVRLEDRYGRAGT